MPHLLGLSLAFSAALTGTSVQVAPAAPQAMPQAQTVQQYVATYFADEPVMIAIAYCESRNRQYDTDGSIFRGIVNNKDVGVMQINEHYHSDTAAKLGLDLFTLQGNTAYARYLYETQGAAPWSSSEPCWGKSKAAKALALASK
jgi:hypothetical protein